MTTRSINSASKQNFVPKIAIPDPDMSSILKDVSDSISPVFPLRDYVAVNPFFGMCGRTFLGTRAYLRVFSECELLMPLSYYAEQYRAGQFLAHDIEQAIHEIHWPSSITPPNTSQVINELFASSPSQESSFAESANSWRQIRTIAEHVTNPEGMNWLEAIRDEITKHCSTHFDHGQATWQSPFRGLGLYAAWRTMASIDRNMEILGLRNMRKLVESLPYCPEDAIKLLLNRLGVPESMWLVVLLCEAFTILGWCSWAKYQDDYRGETQQNLISLLAIRLAYDVALAESSGLTVNWNSYRFEQPIRVSPELDMSSERSWIRYVALVASEISYRNKLLQSLEQDRSKGLASDATYPDQAEDVRPSAQLVFCIDVRSERYRRHLESTCDSVRTFGFAGFFGIPMEFQGVGGCGCNPQLPVLLKSQLQVIEQPIESVQHEFPSPQHKMRERRVWSRLWDSFQTSAVGCFGCVETTGLAAVTKLLTKSLGFTGSDSRKASECQVPMKLVPQWKQSGQALSIQQQADLAERILRNIGLTKDMARLVVFCGHESQTENNPLAAGLDCGACGGHSGEPNARLAAQMLNQLDLRIELADRGIRIPSDTYFLAAVHNTTTDQIRFCDSDLIPESHQSDVQSLLSSTSMATSQTALDRLKGEGSISAGTAIQRARDWSEVRPEWGLAGNAAMIVGPRELTRNSNLDATTFLHSYDYKVDSDGTILETIMTAPMIVANWINMQYYASTVDNLNFGSGNKTLHNVVGQFGILSGNAGDLRTGLPWQSIHNGQRYQHTPLRLLVLIAAPTDRIEHIIRKHALVENLAINGWLQIVSSHEGALLRYDSTGQWVSARASIPPS